MLEKYPRILAIAPSTSGFGFVVVEGINTLVAWGDTRVRKDKNVSCMVKVDEAIARYEPQLLVLENPLSKGVRRSPRIRSLVKQIVARARKRNLRTVALSRDEVRHVFFADSKGTKHRLAELLAQYLPEELAAKLPPERKEWMKEDPRMAMFEAVALAVAFRRLKKSASAA